ncbi:MAG: NfeD family protein [Burkholderiales bacterium]|jgi:membrane protein implicated in regulation of membrane protease activity
MLGVDMAIQYWWWVLALGIGILELVTGTFYLLMIAVGCAAAGAVAAAGGPVWAQFVAAALVALAGAAWVRRARAGAPGRGPAGRNPDVIADVGERVRVEAWDADRRARVRYRGTEWSVELAPGEAAAPGEYLIREVAGNRLILARP